MLDRDGIRKLLLVHPQGRLLHEFQISAPTLRKWLSGAEPKHSALTAWINNKVNHLLHNKPPALGILENYVNDFANHLLAMRGNYVRRYPIDRCVLRYDTDAGQLHIDRKHLERLISSRIKGVSIVDELHLLGVLIGEENASLTAGSGRQQRATVNVIVDLAHTHCERLRLICEYAGNQEEVDQEARQWDSKNG